MHPAACVDFDSIGSGALAAYGLACRAWEIAGRGEYPLRFHEFMGYQSRMRDPGDFFVATADDNAGMPDGGMESALMRHQRLHGEWTGGFGQARDEFLRGGGGFARSVMVYSGAQSMLERLRMMATVCVMGDYDSKMLRHLMRLGGLKADTVLGDDMGRGTGYQLWRLRDWGFDPSSAVYYGPRPKLAAAEDMGFHVVEAVHDDGPSWCPEGPRRASPNDFPDVFAETLGIRARQDSDVLLLI